MTLISRQLNGVELLTKSGRDRRMFSDSERRQIHGATPDDLEKFVDLFCPRGVKYAKTSGGDPKGWKTPRLPSGELAPISEREVLRHLQAELLPGQKPVWVAPRLWEKTRFVCIDVDAHGNGNDFEQRCERLQATLYRLGITQDTWLVSDTPSGGRHYRFILKYDVPCHEIRQLFESVRIPHSPGRFEIFPNQTNGVRLPFGHIPGQKTVPGEWVSWIRKLADGEIRRICWSSVVSRAAKVRKSQTERLAYAPATVARLKPAQVSATSTGGGVSDNPSETPAPRSISTQSLERYRAILSAKPRSVEQVQELERLGICEPGTRYQATKILAWHLLRAKKLSPELVEQRLNDWVYTTGLGISKDVTADVVGNTRRVASENASFIKWLAGQPAQQPNGSKANSKALITEQEVRTVAAHFIQHSELQAIPRCLEFALRFLQFAKSHGTPEDYGFKAYAGVDGIIRKWPRCSGITYKPKRDALIESGFLSVEKKKIQSRNKSGRAVGYGVHVLSTSGHVPLHDVDDAVRIATEHIRAEERKRVDTAAAPELMNRQVQNEERTPVTRSILASESTDSPDTSLVRNRTDASSTRLMTFQQYYRIRRKNSRYFGNWTASQPIEHLNKLEAEYHALQLPAGEITHDHQFCKRRDDQPSKIQTLGQSRRHSGGLQSPARHGLQVSPSNITLPACGAGERGRDTS